ncbi:MAG: (Fe-S)-binding protein [bacterium]
MDNDFFSINKERTILNQCVRCGICSGICPVYRISRLETDSPRGRFELMRYLDENKASSGYDYMSSLSRCLFCLQCQRNCPAGVEFDLAFFHTMGLIYKKNSDTSKGLIYPIHLRRSGNPQTPSLVNGHLLENTIKGAHKREEGIMIFPGCFMELEEIKKIQNFLKDIGIDTFIVPEDICCGLPDLLRGKEKDAIRCMKKNVESFHLMKAKRIVTPCPFCLKMFTAYYPLYLNQAISIEFNHICNFFSSIKVEFFLDLSKKVAYHSPCLLDQKTASDHQRLIEKIAGDSYVPIPADICCGHGVDLPGINEKLSKSICQSNLSRIIERGVKLLITDCPSCTTKWKEVVQEKNMDLEVIPFWDLVIASDRRTKSRLCSL